MDLHIIILVLSLLLFILMIRKESFQMGAPIPGFNPLCVIKPSLSGCQKESFQWFPWKDEESFYISQP